VTPLGGSAVKVKDTCKTAADGDPCDEKVHWAMSDGVFAHPEWYPGLNHWSSYEDFQAVLHKDPKTRSICPKPCECHTTVQGEPCHDKVLWAMKDGIFAHPEWYKGMDKYSRFEAFQLHLHTSPDTKDICPLPCKPPKWGVPSLFCFAVLCIGGYEPDLMRAQLAKGAGIFACEEFMVIGDGVIPLGNGPGGTLQTVPIPHIQVGISKDGTAANTLVFMKAWDKVREDMRYRNHEWTIKADPDSVVLPDRLRQKLAPHVGPALYVKNCAKCSGPGWPMMFGSLEAVSRAAVDAYFDGEQRCATELGWQSWGEDLFLGLCLDHLGVGNIVDLSISGDNVCTGANCGDGWHGNYHPFKNAGAWFSCWDQAKR